METIKTGLVGCGKVGHLHAQALRRLPQSRFVAACDSDFERAQKFAAEYRVKAYRDVEDMIADSHVESLNICTPHPLHAAPAVKAAQAGVHILIEKPLASSLADCDAILNAARKSGARVGTVSQRRFYAPCQRIRRAIDEGKIGRPILGSVVMYGWRDQAYYQSDPWRGTWKGEGGGVLVNQAPHQLDLLQWYMGPVDELFGYWDNLNHPYIEVEDTALAVLRFKNGALGSIVVSNSQNPALYGKVYVHGSNGASLGVQTDSGAMFVAGMSTITEPPINDLWTIPGEQDLLKQWQKEDSDFFSSINAVEYYHQVQIEDFLKAVIDSRDPLITGEEGRKTVEIFTALYRSERDRKPVKFPLTPEAGDARS
ncbi:MAG TPA: Gfo/Idh/MocA family oxidoreductase [Terriglobia bacterium]|nr:Gfo/Idh/MocA family oxidoreductase [Terriglobia bacterium]